MPEVDKIVVVLNPRQKKRKRTEPEWHQGLRADRRGRWTIDSVIMVRGLEPMERGWEALVDWRGPFAPSWVKANDLCGPAKEEARAMAKDLYHVEKGWPELEAFMEELRRPLSPEVPACRWRSPRLLAMALEEPETEAASTAFCCPPGVGTSEEWGGGARVLTSEKTTFCTPCC